MSELKNEDENLSNTEIVEIIDSINYLINYIMEKDNLNPMLWKVGDISVVDDEIKIILRCTQFSVTNEYIFKL